MRSSRTRTNLEAAGHGDDEHSSRKANCQFRVTISCASLGACAQRLHVSPTSESGDKPTRFGPFSSQCRAGNVKIRRGSWNEELFRVLEGFPELAHDDEVDACSGALEMFNPQMKGWGIYELYRQKAEALRAEKQRGEATPTKTNWAPGSMEWQAEQDKSS